MALRNFLGRIMSGFIAFREQFMAADLIDEEDFGDFDARRLRYSILWALYENTAYQTEVHSWATAYKLRLGLYKHIRGIYSPAHRLGAFWQGHIFGGVLDPEAGDGSATPSAIPVEVQGQNEEAIRNGLSMLWTWSNMQKIKDVITLYGSVLGDVGIKVIDDTEKEKVYLEVVYPGIIKDVDLDPYGNVKGYIIEEERPNPRRETAMVTYTEEATRSGQDVVYKTYLNGKPYAWNGEAAEWTMSYGFVPMVMVQHNDVGLDWGWAEGHPARARFHEVDDIASALSDQIRKTVNVIWFFSGLSEPDEPLVLEAGPADTTARPTPQRETLPAIYAPTEGARATALISNLNIDQTYKYLTELLERLDEDFPELRFERLRAGNVSAEALREARKATEEKVVTRRPGYDDALKRVFQMALSIGGMRGLFEGITEESYDNNELDLAIAKRDVFTMTTEEVVVAEKAFWGAATTAKAAGVPLEPYLQLQGWTDEKIAIITKSLEYKERQELQKQTIQGFGMPSREKKP